MSLLPFPQATLASQAADRGVSGDALLSFHAAEKNYALGSLFGGTMNGAAKTDIMVGLTGRNTLHGNSGNDGLLGGIGNDIIEGGSGNNKLVGGHGRDTFVFSFDSKGHDVIEDFQFCVGNIRLDEGITVVKSFQDPDGLHLNLSGGGDVLPKGFHSSGD